MDVQKHIVQRIERCKSARGISTSELARRTGIDRVRLTRILTGERDLKAAEMVWLCAVLNVSPESVLPKPEMLRAATPKQGQ